MPCIECFDDFTNTSSSVLARLIDPQIVKQLFRLRDPCNQSILIHVIVSLVVFDRLTDSNYVILLKTNWSEHHCV